MWLCWDEDVINNQITPLNFLQNVITESTKLDLGWTSFSWLSQNLKEKVSTQNEIIHHDVAKLLDVLEKNGHQKPNYLRAIKKSKLRMSGRERFIRKVLDKKVDCRIIANAKFLGGEPIPQWGIGYVIIYLMGIHTFGASSKTKYRKTR